MTTYAPGTDMLTEYSYISELQRIIGSKLPLDPNEDGAQSFGNPADIWVEVFTSRKGIRRTQATLLRPADFGLPDFATVEIRDLQLATPRFIGKVAASYEDRMEEVDITAPEQRRRIAGIFATIARCTD